MTLGTIAAVLDAAVREGRGQDPPPVVFQRYDQDAWVGRQRYAEVPFREIASLWGACNRHLAYVTHLRHHLEQIRALVTP